MAEKRMLTKKITDDDHFQNLSSSAQALYLHLTLSADDDGFCNQVNASMFKAHASVQDLEALLAARYLIQFENGVIVIKHWRMANALRKDRYTPTVFQEELARLKLKENGAYTEREDMVAAWLPSGCQMVATDKIREDKNRLDKRESINYQAIVDLYNETCVSLPSVHSLSDARKKSIKARLSTYSVDDFSTLFKKAEASSFLKGKNNRNWQANFDWLVKDGNMAKVLDGNYDDKVSKAAEGYFNDSVSNESLAAFMEG